MRNLKKYPVTPDEVKDTLQELIESELNNVYGNMEPYILSLIKDFFENNPDQMDKLLNSTLENNKIKEQGVVKYSSGMTGFVLSLIAIWIGLVFVILALSEFCFN